MKRVLLFLLLILFVSCSNGLYSSFTDSNLSQDSTNKGQTYIDKLIELGFSDEEALKYIKIASEDFPNINSIKKYEEGYYATTSREDLLISFDDNMILNIYDQNFFPLVVNDKVNKYYWHTTYENIENIKKITFNVIKSVLKNPESAEFYDITVSRYSYQENAFVVNLKVKAKNSFGNFIVNDYKCGIDVNINTNKLSCFYLKSENEVLFDKIHRFSIDPNNGENVKKFEYTDNYYLDPQYFDYSYEGFQIEYWVIDSKKCSVDLLMQKLNNKWIPDDETIIKADWISNTKFLCELDIIDESIVDKIEITYLEKYSLPVPASLYGYDFLGWGIKINDKVERVTNEYGHSYEEYIFDYAVEFSPIWKTYFADIACKKNENGDGYIVTYIEPNENIYIPDVYNGLPITEIESAALLVYNENVESITLPKHLVKLNHNWIKTNTTDTLSISLVFRNLESVKYIGSFGNNIEIKDKLSIGPNVEFVGVSNKNVYYDVDVKNEKYCSSNGTLMSKNKDTLFSAYSENNCFEVDDEVRKIESSAFHNTNVQILYLNNVNEVSDFFLYGASEVTHIYSNVDKISVINGQELKFSSSRTINLHVKENVLNLFDDIEYSNFNYCYDI